MSFALPHLDRSQVRDLADLSRRFLAFVDGAYEFLRLLPTFEVKQFTTVGNYPIFVQTQTRRAVAVLRSQSFITDDPGSDSSYASDTSIAWRLSDDPEQPGILVTSLGGVTGPDELTVTIVVLGERA